MIDKIKVKANHDDATKVLATLIEARKGLDSMFGANKATLSSEAKARIMHGIRVIKLLENDIDEALKP